jgi:hypothetical protein
MKKIGFLNESTGERSYIRLQSLMLTVLFMAVVCYQAYKGEFSFEVLLLLASFATGPKVVQKFVEAKSASAQAPAA